jgi:hypothetical protein
MPKKLLAIIDATHLINMTSLESDHASYRDADHQVYLLS